MLDAGLIQNYLSTPTIEKRALGVSRSLHRRAMHGILDEAIRTLEEKSPGDRLPGGWPDYAAYHVTAEELEGTPAEGLIDVSRLGGPHDATASHEVGDLHFRLLLLLRSHAMLGWPRH
jgi:hypothetical protein